MGVTAAARSAAKIRPRSIARRATWRAHRKEHCGRRPGRSLRSAAGLRHRRGRSGQRAGGYFRHREDRSANDSGSGSRELQADAAGSSSRSTCAVRSTARRRRTDTLAAAIPTSPGKRPTKPRNWRATLGCGNRGGPQVKLGAARKENSGAPVTESAQSAVRLSLFALLANRQQRKANSNSAAYQPQGNSFRSSWE
jgi:hypothetical protein